MTALLLDTRFLIDIERDDHDLDAWIDDDDAMAAVTVAELQVGVELASRRHRERRADFVQAIIEVVPVLPTTSTRRSSTRDCSPTPDERDDPDAPTTSSSPPRPSPPAERW